MSGYGIDLTVRVGFTEAVERAKDALAARGFGILTEIDVAATMKAKLDVEMPPYLILGACMPALAHRALEVDPSIGLLLPCNVVVRAVDADTTLVQVADPDLLLGVADEARLHPIAAEARARLTAALADIEAGAGDRAATVKLNPAELQLIKHALHSFLTDFGHDEADVTRSISDLLAKLAASGDTALPTASNGESCLAIPA